MLVEGIVVTFKAGTLSTAAKPHVAPAGPKKAP